MPPAGKTNGRSLRLPSRLKRAHCLLPRGFLVLNRHGFERKLNLVGRSFLSHKRWRTVKQKSKNTSWLVQPLCYQPRKCSPTGATTKRKVQPCFAKIASQQRRSSHWLQWTPCMCSAHFVSMYFLWTRRKEKRFREKDSALEERRRVVQNAETDSIIS